MVDQFGGCVLVKPAVAGGPVGRVALGANPSVPRAAAL